MCLYAIGFKSCRDIRSFSSSGSSREGSIQIHLVPCHWASCFIFYTLYQNERRATMRHLLHWMWCSRPGLPNNNYMIMSLATKLFIFFCRFTGESSLSYRQGQQKNVQCENWRCRGKVCIRRSIASGCSSVGT